MGGLTFARSRSPRPDLTAAHGCVRVSPTLGRRRGCHVGAVCPPTRVEHRTCGLRPSQCSPPFPPVTSHRHGRSRTRRRARRLRRATTSSGPAQDALRRCASRSSCPRVAGPRRRVRSASSAPGDWRYRRRRRRASNRRTRAGRARRRTPQPSVPAAARAAALRGTPGALRTEGSRR